MKFGKYLISNSVPEVSSDLRQWRQKYIDYRILKKYIKLCAGQDGSVPDSLGSEESLKVEIDTVSHGTNNLHRLGWLDFVDNPGATSVYISPC